MPQDITNMRDGAKTAPFDTTKLDQLMDTAGLDLVIASSKHNVQYLLGGHRSSFFHFMDAVGTSRYLPLFINPKGRPDLAAYIGHKLESSDHDAHPFWVPFCSTTAFGVADAVAGAVAHVKDQGVEPRCIGTEEAFLPFEAHRALCAAFPAAEFSDALFPLERLRAVKTDWEIEQLTQASERVLAAMLATFERTQAGMTKAEIIEILRFEEVKRGLTYEYCWLSFGPNLNRVATDQRLEDGAAISIDSGANFAGYVGDLARMAISGTPDSEHIRLLDQIETIQNAAFDKIAPGSTGRDIHSAAEAARSKSSIHEHSHFVAHGMGLISHEAPRLTSDGPIRYDGYDADNPLEPGMVISVETTAADPSRGAVKLEDALLITDAGFRFLGEGARGWNRVGGNR